MKSVIIVFLDGVGLGSADAEANPFMHVDMQIGRQLFNSPHLTRPIAGTITSTAALLGVDATLGVPGLPQSGTGQTAILTGHNAPAKIGQHYGPYPTPVLRHMLARDSLFKAILAANQPVAYANAYPDRFLDRAKRGKGRLSANTTAAFMAGLKLRSHEDLQQGRAIAALLSNDFWPESDVILPPLSAYEAGQQLVALGQDHKLTFFEFWYSDVLGHKMKREESIRVLMLLDEFFAGILTRLDIERTMLLIISDHGNFEDWTTKKHTLNPALGMVVTDQADLLAPRLQSLTDVKSLVLSYLFEGR